MHAEQSTQNTCSAHGYSRHLQMLSDVFCSDAKKPKLSQLSSDGATQTKSYKHRAAKITEANKQVNTEHCVLLSLFSSLSQSSVSQTHSHTAVM